MNHKRKRPKNARAGCLQCKPAKMNHAKRSKRFMNRKQLVEREKEKEIHTAETFSG